MNIDGDTWIISDTHFGHKNIVKYCNRPMEHNQIMLRNWRNLVAPGDTILHLGDLAVWYGPTEDMWLYTASTLPGNKFMLRGNHDKRKDKVYADHGFVVIPEFIQEFNGQRVLFSHHPDEEDRPNNRLGQWDINIHGHIHNNNESLDRLSNINRRYINVSVEVMEYKPVRLRSLITV